MLLKPAPSDVVDAYFQSLAAMGLDPLGHDLRLVEDDWESPTLGAAGLGWQVWCDGTEISQFTYFQQCGGLELPVVSAELTYGLARIGMMLQGTDRVQDLLWAPGVSWGDLWVRNEWEWSRYNFEQARCPPLVRAAPNTARDGAADNGPCDTLAMSMRMQRSLVQFLESYRAKGLASTLGEICYRNRQCIVLVSDLSSLGPPVNLTPDLNAVFREVFPFNFEDLRLKYRLKSRHLKAVANLAQGYASFAVTRGGEVLGDMWYAGRADSAATALHPDLAMLEIDSGKDGVYLWDTYVNEAERSTNVALSLLSPARTCYC